MRKQLILPLVIILFASLCGRAQTGGITYIPKPAVLTGRTLNQSYPVGSLPGTANVGLGGSATYSVPIEVPKGIRGLEPSLQLVYNHLGGDGQLGQGWQLSGISAISRIGTAYRYDRTHDGMDLDGTDRFSLDGKQIVRKDKNGFYDPYFESGAEYRTFVESYTDVEAVGLSGEGPLSFIVRTKEGMTIEYGGTTNSRYKIGAYEEVLIWFVSKISDPVGNFMLFDYEANGNEIPRISSILYTGNEQPSGSLPSASYVPRWEVLFDYEIRADKIEKYRLGVSYTNPYLLTSIRVRQDGTQIYKYVLNYSLICEESKLTEVYRLEKDGSRMNSTVFQWQDQPCETDVTTTSITDMAGILIPADLNGDGLLDIVAQHHGSGNDTKILAYININGIAYSTYTVENWFNSTQSVGGNIIRAVSTSISDRNGDGLNEIVVTRTYSLNAGPFPKFKSTFYSFDGGAFTQSDVILIEDKYASYNNDVPYPVPLMYDFNGDGRTDFTWPSKSVGNWWIQFGTSSGFTNKVEIPLTAMQDSIYPGDFNGDGKIDLLMNGYNNNIYDYVIYTLSDVNNAGAFWNILWQGTLPGITKVAVGDFNGDGLSDLLIGQEAYNIFGIPGGYAMTIGNPDWEILVSTGISFISSDFDLGGMRSSVVKKDLIWVADYNGDGYSDILEIAGDYAHAFGSPIPVTNDIPLKTWMYTNRIGIKAFDAEELTAIPRFPYREYVLSDFTGDGLPDLICRNTTQDKIWQFNAAETHFVEGISDGMQRTTLFEYLSLNNLAVYERTMTSPIIVVAQPALYVTKKLRLDNGLGGYVEDTYYYRDLWVDRQGGGILGFREIEKLSQLGIKEVRRNRLESTLVIPDKTQLISVLDQLLQEKVYDYVVTTPSFQSIGYQFYFESKLLKETDRNLLTNTSVVKEYTGIDAYGNVTQTLVKTYPSSSVFTGHLTSETVTNTIGHFGSWCPSSITASNVTKTRTNEADYTASMSFDYFSNGLLKERVSFVGLPNPITESYTYDRFGNILTTSYHGSIGSPRTTIYTYDGTKRFISSVTNPAGHIAETVYDTWFGEIVSKTDANELTATFTINGMGRLIEVDRPDGTSDQIIQGWTNGLANAPATAIWFEEVNTTNAPVSITYYDCLNRAVRKESVDMEGRTLFTDVIYDSYGRKFKESEPYISGNQPIWIEYGYDNMGRKISVESPVMDVTYAFVGAITTETNGLTGQQKRTTIDCSGRVNEVIDDGGQILYEYYSHGEIRETNSFNGKITVEYDDYLRQSKIIDDNAGTIEFQYNHLGEAVSYIDARGNSFGMEYDVLGRLISQVGPSHTIGWEYDTKPKGKGKLSSMWCSNGISQTFTYDGLGRIEEETERIDGVDYTFSYGYDGLGQLERFTYPSGFAIVRNYNSDGYLTRVKRFDNDDIIWEALNVNGYGQITQFKQGPNQLSVFRTYSSYGLLEEIGGSALEYFTSFDAPTGNLDWRTDNIYQETEAFMYDGLDRLTNVSLNGQPFLEMTFHANGNILSKSDVGSCYYNAGNAGPNALT